MVAARAKVATMTKKTTKTFHDKAGLTESQWQALLSYARSLLAAAATVIAVSDWTWSNLGKALLAAAIPPLLRWANPNDPAFGRVK